METVRKTAGARGKRKRRKIVCSFCVYQQKATICARFPLGQNRRMLRGDFASPPGARPALGCFLHWPSSHPASTPDRKGIDMAADRPPPAPTICRGRSRQLSLPALVQFATVEALVDHEPVILNGAAPAVLGLMVAKIIDRIDMIGGHRPSHPGVWFAAHRSLLARAISRSEMSYFEYLFQASWKAASHVRRHADSS